MQPRDPASIAHAPRQRSRSVLSNDEADCCNGAVGVTSDRQADRNGSRIFSVVFRKRRVTDNAGDWQFEVLATDVAGDEIRWPQNARRKRVPGIAPNRHAAARHHVLEEFVPTHPQSSEGRHLRRPTCRELALDLHAVESAADLHIPRRRRATGADERLRIRDQPRTTGQCVARLNRIKQITTCGATVEVELSSAQGRVDGHEGQTSRWLQRLSICGSSRC